MTCTVHTSGYATSSCQWTVGRHCLDWAIENNDTWLLQQFFDAAGGGKLMISLDESWMRATFIFFSFIPVVSKRSRL